MFNINKLKDITLLTSCFFILSCQNINTNQSDFGIDLNSIQIGSLKDNNFVKREDKSFVSEEKINLRFLVKGLTIKSGKIKLNIDIFLKKDKEVIGVEGNILGEEGFLKEVSGINSNYEGNTGSSEINLSITPPKEVKGEISANITIKDLHSTSKISTFETKFIIK